MKESDSKEVLFSTRDLFKLITPLLVEQLLAITVGLADSVMVAGVGEAAVSAVSLVDSVNILIINIFAALATGGAVVVGQYLGRKNNEKACRSAEQLVMVTTVLSIGIMTFMYMGKGFILNNLFGTIAPDVKVQANTYLMIVSLSIPFIALYNGGAAVFRAMSNSKITMYTSIIMNLINVAGNALLIYGFKMGVAGAAIPTLLSRIIGAVIIIILLKRKRLPVHLRQGIRFTMDFSLIKKILFIGIPNGLENSMFQLGKILVLNLVASFGTASIAANAIAGTMGSYQILPGSAIGLALVTVVSRAVGAGDYKQVRYYTKKLMIIAYGAMIVINILFILALPIIVRIYNLSDLTADLTKSILTYSSICSAIIWPMSFTLPNALRAASDVRYSMVISIISMWTFRIGLSYVLGKYMGMGVFGVWVAMTVDWVFRSIFFIIRYRGSKWQHIRI
ncbi:MATE family efflux transporter [Alloiococcus sp. CFN-8]|uniref:MATE family efflux transporter n=1 Tax=Alloiococcus sp. CFN-8 TaxID=3416081 RepID=UPI003CF10FDB